MKDHYPPTTIPPDYLVQPQAQPEYNDLDGVELDEFTTVADHLVDQHVRAGSGDHTAVIHAESGRSYTFAQLAKYSECLAKHLVTLGVLPGDRVAFRSLNVPEVLIAVLAIWKAGGVIVPTPAQSRAHELRFFVEDTEPRVLMVLDEGDLAKDLEAAIDGTTIEHVLAIGEARDGHIVSNWTEIIGADIPGAELPRVHADSVAIVWHTGGTTGQPKACYHTHRRFLLGGYSVGRATGVAPGERWAAAAPIGHALGVIFHTIHTLLHGATVVMIERLQRPDHVLEAIKTHRIDTFAAITASWAGMLDALRERPTDISPLKRGFAMWQSASSTHVRDEWRRHGIELLNNFGTTAFATWVLVPRAGEAFEDASLGRAIDSYTVEGVQVRGGRVTVEPPGSIARMAVKGPTGLTYWRRPEQQARDVVDGWTLVDDMVRFDDAGNATYYGRTDFLISTAGHKVAPVEVEFALTQHPAVREAGVVGAPDALRVEIVAAFVALNADAIAGEALVKELQQLVKTQLSPYKYPRRIEFVDALPRDHVGKVQHGLLKQWTSADGPPPLATTRAGADAT